MSKEMLPGNPETSARDIFKLPKWWNLRGESNCTSAVSPIAHPIWFLCKIVVFVVQCQGAACKFIWKSCDTKFSQVKFPSILATILGCFSDGPQNPSAKRMLSCCTPKAKMSVAP